MYSQRRNKKKYTNARPRQAPQKKDDNKSIIEKIKEADIVIYSSPLCFYCIRLKQMLSSDTINYLQYMKVIEDRDQFPPNIHGLPFIIARKTGIHIEGAPNTIDDFFTQILVGL